MKKQIEHTDLKEIILFFQSLENFNYCVIKKPSNFPFLYIGSDIDIVVDDIDAFEEKFKAFFSAVNNYNILKSKIGLGKTHFDIYQDGKFLIRFDTHFHKPETINLYLKNNFYDDIFDSVVDYKFEFEKVKSKIKIPELKFEILIRIIEFSAHPEKLHHKIFLKSKLNEIKANKQFVDSYLDVNINKLLRSNYVSITLKNFTFKIKKRLKLSFLHNKLLESIFLKPLQFTRQNQKFIDIGWMKVRTSSFIIVPINKISVNLKNSTGVVKNNIEETPHFKFIMSHKYNLDTNKLDYQDYLISNFTEINSENITEYVDKFISLYESYEKTPGIYELIVYRDKNLFLKNNPTLLDGVHRLSIMKIFNQEFVKCYISDNK